MAADEVVADLERACLDEHGGDRSAAALEVRVDDGPERVAVGVRFELEDVGGQNDRGEQVVDALACAGAEVHTLVLAAVVAHDDALLRQLLVHPVRVGVVLVDLVDRDDDRHLGRSRVVDRLDRLGHHAVIGGDDQHDQVRDLRASGAHRSESLVPWRVDEHDRMPVGGLDLVGADPLGDAAGLARGDVCLADRVQDRRLAVVDVAQHGDDGRPWLELGRVFVGEREELFAGGGDDVPPILAGLDGDDVLACDRLDREAEFVGHDLGRGEVDDLVHVGEDAGGHQLLDDVDRADAKLLRQVLDRQVGRQHGPAVAVGLDLGHDRRRLEGGAGSLDRAGRQWRGGVAGQPALLQEVDQLLLADAKFACEFVCLHAGTTDYAAGAEFET